MAVNFYLVGVNGQTGGVLVEVRGGDDAETAVALAVIATHGDEFIAASPGFDERCAELRAKAPSILRAAAPKPPAPDFTPADLPSKEQIDEANAALARMMAGAVPGPDTVQ